MSGVVDVVVIAAAVADSGDDGDAATNECIYQEFPKSKHSIRHSTDSHYRAVFWR